jgi:hypothetical protein
MVVLDILQIIINAVVGYLVGLAGDGLRDLFDRLFGDDPA